MHLQMTLDGDGKPVEMEVFATPITVEPVDIMVTENAVITGKPGEHSEGAEVGYLATFLYDRLPFNPDVVLEMRAKTRSPAFLINWEALSYVVVEDIAPKVEIVFREAV